VSWVQVAKAIWQTIDDIGQHDEDNDLQAFAYPALDGTGNIRQNSVLVDTEPKTVQVLAPDTFCMPLSAGR
jgi:hypothetical protein